MGRSPFSPRPPVRTHVKRWEMSCHLLDDAFPRPRQYTPGCWVRAPCRSTPFSVIWVMPIDLRSPLHSSASMIADFLADHEPLVSGPSRKKVLHGCLLSVSSVGTRWETR